MSDQLNVEGQAAQVEAAWGRIVAWLEQHAPTSYASLLPPAPETEMANADAALRQHLGFAHALSAGVLA
ncbi:hypothetical protein OH809_37280 [Streptomyces sp. NBC_00873]|uniref:hypothetical protein n=1 Tax=unclassified Streptomyces TaxID=2593676 RepID=UPI00386A1E4B|nr:hypothetical protein OH809_37280 [Streptomyces sp. NBC_00873]WTA42292.1 hypothetical protein OH821_06430 [Streptomyces sp. NBC_00842]